MLDMKRKKPPLCIRGGFFDECDAAKRLVAAGVDRFVFADGVQIEGALLRIVAAATIGVVQVKITIGALHAVLLGDFHTDGLDSTTAASHAVVFGNKVAIWTDFRRHDGLHFEQRKDLAPIPALPRDGLQRPVGSSGAKRWNYWWGAAGPAAGLPLVLLRGREPQVSYCRQTGLLKNQGMTCFYLLLSEFSSVFYGCND